MAGQNQKKYALVTGATSGFGYEFCKLLANDGYNLVIVARSEERLSEVAEEIASQFAVEVIPLSVDLFEKNAADAIYETTRARGISIEILVNDAGQGEYGRFTETDLERELDIIQLNITSVVCLTKYFLKDMIAKNRGRILQVSSLLSVYPTPLMAVYAASKAFVLVFTESLINEIKDTDVTMTALLPGASDTDFFHKAGSEESYIYQQTELSDPVQVAKDGYEALMKGERKIVSGFKNKVQAGIANLMPDSALAGMMEKQMKPSDEHKRDGSTHEPSRAERDMIQAASNTYENRDLQNHNEDSTPGR